MKAQAFLAAAALLLAAVDPAAAQQTPRRDPSVSTPPPAPVRVQIPAGGLTFNFTDIDRNNDRSISVEEWNAFVASLQSRIGQKTPGAAAAGGTSAGKQPRPAR